MPQRKKAAKGPTLVEALTHEEKRVNIPTADAQDFVADQLKEPVPLCYPRDPDLDPQLVWSGKDDQDSRDLLVEAPALYIQEKLDPRALVENLRRTADAAGDEPELTLFDSFDGLRDWESVDYYRHASNWSNRLILGDSLQVMASLAERENLRGQVQMIYVDPPYGIKFGSNWQVRARKRDVADGRIEDATREVEQIKAFRDTWELGIHSYLAYLRERLVVARDLLASSGSCFVQIGSTNMHYVATLMAEIFGPENHMETIAFRKKTMPLGGRYLEGAYDYLVWFARDKENVKYRKLFQRQNVQGDTHWNVAVMPDGELRQLSRAEVDNHGLLPDMADPAQLIGLYPVGAFATGVYDFPHMGRVFELPVGKSWPSPIEGMKRLALAGRLVPYSNGSTLRYLLKHSDYPVTVYNNVWSDTSAATGMTYVVETSPKVVQRCLLMTTDPGDLVLDPTCGSGTTAYVAEQWGRRWIAVDTSRVAITLARQRLMAAMYPHYLLSDSAEGRVKEAALMGSSDASQAPRGDVRKGFVYRQVAHITLKSIANNPDVKDGMSRESIEGAIARHAEREFLLDDPYDDSRKVRVAGPFTVEGTSPHRSISTGTIDGKSHSNLDSERSLEAFGNTVLANLLVSGVQTGRTDRRLAFESMEPLAGRYLVAKMHPRESGPVQERIAVTIGPRYGTVGADWIKGAAREAHKGQGFGVLLVLGFAFDPLALETVAEFQSSGGEFELQRETRMGGLRILLVRMNADLAMGEKLLKKSKNANLFTVFGEPDISLEKTEDGWVVEVVGFDVYNPVTGEVVSGNDDDIAMWMVDSDYDEESFFVRHAYFPGRQDPYARLKRALKADIDESAWETLNSTTSRPFPTPSTGKIAVKVVNDYGDEVMRVLDIPAAK